MYFLPTLPHARYLTGACQRLNLIGRHTLLQRVTGRIAQGLGIKNGVRALLGRGAAKVPREPLGVASRFAEGDWVRVRDAASVRQTLDERSRLRGLQFAPSQWQTCSKVYRVDRVVRRIVDDHGKLRPVSLTVLLAGVHCGGEAATGGCGRRCPMMYRDDWLEAAETAPEASPAPQEGQVFARVRPLEQILARLDVLGQRDGLMFMPEMVRHVGIRAAVVCKLPQVFEHNRWMETPRPVHILEGLHCTGAIFGGHGPCHRACPLLWHADWLEFEAWQTGPPSSVRAWARPVSY
jgi:hypothetical protein